MKKIRLPWLAGLLSLITPGLGQLYCGRAYRALLIFAYIIIGYNSILYLFFWNDIKPFNVIIPILFLLSIYPLSIGDAFLLAKKQTNFHLSIYNKWYIYILYSFIFAITYIFTSFFADRYEAYKNPAESMEDTLLVGDYFFGDKKAYIETSPERGDIVLFIYPKDQVTKYIKRCVALPGDTVFIKDRIVYVNGIQREEPTTVKFINPNIQPRMAGGRNSMDNFGPIVIPENSYFMMGDNRDNSYDSRGWGTVPRELIIGKAKTIHWSADWNRIGMIPK